MKHTGVRRFGQTVGVMLSISLAAACGRQPVQLQGPPPVAVQLQLLQPGSFQDSSEFVGSLEAQDRVELRPEAEGRITQVFVASGDSVEQGQPILQLNSAQAQAPVDVAEAGRAAARSATDAAQARLDAAQSDLSRLEADVQLADIEYRRTASLVEDGALSRQDLDTAQNRIDVANAQLAQAIDNVRSAQAELSRAEFNLQQASSQVDVDQESLNFKAVSAPITGFLGDIDVKIGDYVSTGQLLTTVTQNDFLYLQIRVPTTRIDQLGIGLTVELIDPNAGNRLTPGSISFISPEVDSGAQSILVKARFPNEDERLREGQYVRARIIWSTSTALLVPTVAVTRVGNQSFVYVAGETADENGQTLQVVTQRPVQLGGVQGDSYQVLDGLESGEQVAVTNILKLQDGVPIQSESQSSETLADDDAPDS